MAPLRMVCSRHADCLLVMTGALSYSLTYVDSQPLRIILVCWELLRRSDSSIVLCDSIEAIVLLRSRTLPNDLCRSHCRHGKAFRITETTDGLFLERTESSTASQESFVDGTILQVL